MRYIKIFSFILASLLFSTSCQDALDINTNPLVASSADPNVLLPFVIIQYSNRHTTELGTRIMDVPQHFSACFNSPRNGNTSIFLTGNTWGMYYTQVLGNLQLVEQDARDAGPSSNNVAAIAIILKAQSFFELSSIWENVPFSEALDGASFPSPNFDSQESIFRGVVSFLDEAIGLIDGMPAEGVFDVSTGDLIYEGDMDKWRKLANSMKLRTLMMLRNVDASVDGAINAALGQPLIENNADAAMLRYYNTPAESNGYNRLVEAFFGIGNEAQGVYAPGDPLYELLWGSGDPRTELIISDPDSAGAPGNGQFAFGVGGATITNNVIRNDIPHMIFLPAEVNFYRAELALKGVTGDNAQEQFNLGLTNIIKWWGQDIPGAELTASSDAIAAYVDGLPALTNDEDGLRRVHEQQYLETFLRPVVAWNTVRRTGFPELKPPPGTNITTYLKRFNYPPDEVSSNPNTPANPNTDVPMWFEN